MMFPFFNSHYYIQTCLFMQTFENFLMRRATNTSAVLGILQTVPDTDDKDDSKIWEVLFSSRDISKRKKRFSSRDISK